MMVDVCENVQGDGKKKSRKHEETVLRKVGEKRDGGSDGLESEKMKRWRNKETE